MALAAIGGGIGMGREIQMLPSVSEMTTGMSPYNTPAYTMSIPTSGYMGTGNVSLGPVLPAIGGMMALPPRHEAMYDAKRRASPDMGQRETSRNRQ